MLRSANELKNQGFELTEEQKHGYALDIYGRNILSAGDRDILHWGVDEVLEKLDDYDFRCAVTGIPISQGLISMDRITDSASFYCPDHTTPMLHGLNMGKGCMKRFFQDQENLKKNLTGGFEVDFAEQREAMVEKLREIVQELVESEEEVLVEETVANLLQ